MRAKRLIECHGTGDVDIVRRGTIAMNLLDALILRARDVYPSFLS
jgi:hypothetical protein